MNWYVFYKTGKWDPWILEIISGGGESVYTAEKKVLDLLNKYVLNSEFEFKVVYGNEVKFKPVQVVTKYEKE